MHLMITGGTGFIGRHVVRRCVELGHDVTALRRPDSPRKGISEIRPTQWLEASMTEVMHDAFAGIDVVVHMAAVGVSPQPATMEAMYRVNFLESLTFLRRAAESGVRKIVMVGSAVEYGRSGDLYDYIPPDAPLEPMNHHAVSKAAASLAAPVLAQEFSLRLVLLRPFNCFGEGQFEKTLWATIKRAALAGEDLPISSGSSIRDFSPVELVAEEISREATDANDEPGFFRRNLGTGKTMTVLEFVETWWKHWDAKGKILVGALPDRTSDPKRMVPQL